MKSQACQPGSWTERDQAIDFRAKPISPQHAGPRTEIIPIGYVQWAPKRGFVVHDDTGAGAIKKLFQKLCRIPIRQGSVARPWTNSCQGIQLGLKAQRAIRGSASIIIFFSFLLPIANNADVNPRFFFPSMFLNVPVAITHVLQQLWCSGIVTELPGDPPGGLLQTLVM